MDFVESSPYSDASEIRNVLRTTALCSAELPQLDLSVSTGVHDGAAVVKALLCGARAAQVCTAIHLHGFEVIGEMNRFVDEWAARHGFRLDRGLPRPHELPQQRLAAFQRVQYMKYFPRSPADRTHASRRLGPGTIPGPRRFRTGYAGTPTHSHSYIRLPARTTARTLRLRTLQPIHSGHAPPHAPLSIRTPCPPTRPPHALPVRPGNRSASRPGSTSSPSPRPRMLAPSGRASSASKAGKIRRIVARGCFSSEKFLNL